ncbi:dipicolinate synthase subunit DpsA [Konateibacter massiliensis]|uniref:dipicolinate synthase subunit DpsA n=1 Tax=Konateibacter massiliensis TaxID=2002841 RepID=UPI000C15DA2B|nr:dipicolinate synthase subunit DpsA [Konateibacter massiliensis]
MSGNRNIAVIGGDKRQLYMCKLLAEKDFHVITLGVNLAETNINHIETAQSLETIMKDCDIIIGPIPFTRDGIHIYSDTDVSVRLDEFVSFIRQRHILLGGCMDELTVEKAKSQNAVYFDFMEDETVAVKNAIATAEGTILEAIRQSDINLCESRCLVTGYGRCAKVLAESLKALKANVTIAARSKEQRASAREAGFHTISLEEASKELFEFDFLFNTIPAMIITASWLAECKREVVIIDIASKPGGTDFEQCKKLGIKAVLALGLPGKYAPKTSAEILLQSMEHLLPS